MPFRRNQLVVACLRIINPHAYLSGLHDKGKSGVLFLLLFLEVLFTINI